MTLKKTLETIEQEVHDEIATRVENNFKSLLSRLKDKISCEEGELSKLKEAVEDKTVIIQKFQELETELKAKFHAALTDTEVVKLQQWLTTEYNKIIKGTK